MVARDDLRSAARFVEMLEPVPEKIIVCAGYLADLFEYYYHGDIPVERVMLSPAVTTADAVLGVLPHLPELSRFVLIYSRPDHGDPHRLLEPALEKTHRSAVKKHWTGVDLLIFTKE